MKISIVGLGNIGLPMAVAYASKGHQVIGVDNNPEWLEVLLGKRKYHFTEPLVEKYLQKYSNNLTFLISYRQAIEKSDITFIVTPTPSTQRGAFSLVSVQKVVEELGEYIRDKKFYHLVVVSSTISPTSSDDQLIPLLEQTTEKLCGAGLLGYCYSPELVARGTVVQDFVQPDMFLIGASDWEADQRLTNFYFSINNTVPIKRTNPTTAEVVKLAINCFLTMKISFGNTIGELGDHLPTLDPQEVIEIMGWDSRINPAFMRPGFGFGCPCFPRDNNAFVALANAYRMPAHLFEAVNNINEWQINRFIKEIQRHVGLDGEGNAVALLGTAYKPGVASVEGSMAVKLARKLATSKYIVRVYDPLALEETKKELGDSVVYCDNPKECIKGAGVAMVCTPGLEIAQILGMKNCQDLPIIDPWGLL